MAANLKAQTLDERAAATGCKRAACDGWCVVDASPEAWS